MILRYESFSEFVKESKSLGITSDLFSLRSLDILFYEIYDEYMIISLPFKKEIENIILILSQKKNLVYPEISKKTSSLKIGKIKKRKYLESTLLAYEVLSITLSKYTTYYDELRKRMIAYEHDKLMSDNAILEAEKDIIKLNDIAEDFLQMLLEIEEKETKFVDTEIMEYEFDILVAKTRYLCDRLRRLKGDVDMLLSRKELIENKKMTFVMERLTRVMTVFTLVSIVISIPNTIATFYGVQPLSKGMGAEEIWVLILLSAIISTILAYWYYLNIKVE